ncbi:MAG: hypothetical protein K6C40_09495 [Thermoguttaceae bacterium]|nr:hypothetical protein [Thermoguttaceae bacterium]
MDVAVSYTIIATVCFQMGRRWKAVFQGRRTRNFCAKTHRVEDQLFEESADYPNFKPYEKCLIYKLGNPEEQDHARKQFTRASHLKAPADILAVMVLRTASVLGNAALFQNALHNPFVTAVADG